MINMAATFQENHGKDMDIEVTRNANNAFDIGSDTNMNLMMWGLGGGNNRYSLQTHYKVCIIYYIKDMQCKMFS